MELKRQDQEDVETREITTADHKAAQRGKFHQWPRDFGSDDTKTEELHAVEEELAEKTAEIDGYNAEARAVIETQPAALTIGQLEIARSALLRKRRACCIHDNQPKEEISPRPEQAGRAQGRQ